MQIIWNQQAAEKLMNSHTVLELETFDVNGEPVTGWCVVPAEKIILEIAQLDFNKQKHQEFIQCLKDKNHDRVIALAEQLLGRFGGELDSFYQIIVERIQANK